VRPLIYIFFYSISKIFYSYNSRTHLCKMGLLPVSVLKAHYNVTYIMQGTIYMVPHAWEISGMELHFRAQYLGPVSHSIRLYTLVGKTSISTSIVVGTGTYAWYWNLERCNCHLSNPYTLRFCPCIGRLWLRPRSVN